MVELFFFDIVKFLILKYWILCLEYVNIYMWDKMEMIIVKWFMYKIKFYNICILMVYK